MNITNLFEAQKALDAHIIKSKGLEGQDLLPNLVLALQVEVGELANEWRGFKHWSNDRKPRNEYYTPVLIPIDGEDDFEKRNPLLEEYVDCLSFFLAIANVMNLRGDDLFSYDEELEGETNRVFIELSHHVGMILMDTEVSETVGRHDRMNFRVALFIFTNLGLQRLGFTWEQIVEAYHAKNKINYERQLNGY